MRAGWFLAMVFVAFVAAGCQNSTEKSDSRDSVPRYSSRPRKPAEGLDYDSYAGKRSAKRLQALEDQADAEQDGLADEELTAARPKREARTTRRPSGAFGTEEEEPEEALARNRSDRPTKEDYFKLGTSGRLDEESLDEDQAASDILSDDEDDPRRR
jgi:hypothetical protein